MEHNLKTLREALEDIHAPSDELFEAFCELDKLEEELQNLKPNEWCKTHETEIRMKYNLHPAGYILPSTYIRFFVEHEVLGLEK